MHLGTLPLHAILARNLVTVRGGRAALEYHVQVLRVDSVAARYLLAMGSVPVLGSWVKKEKGVSGNFGRFRDDERAFEGYQVLHQRKLHHPAKGN